MRPHKLTMKAFGPFAAATVIDFDLMGNNIYLISGNTGAGKTTIFDGIIYALYGTASGGARSRLGTEAFHSDYAKEGGRREEMRVELTFSNAGRTFTVCRRMYWGKKGDSKTVTKESTLSENGNTIVYAKGTENKDDVTKKVTEILGLDADQFRRIIMLAQGEFQRFLTAKSDERGTILGKLYDNRKHQDFQLRLKAASALLKEKENAAVEEAKAQLKMFVIPDDTDETDRAEITLDHINLLPAIQRVCGQMSAELDVLQVSISENTEEKNRLEGVKNQGETYNRLLDQLDEQTCKLKELDEKEAETDAKRDLVRRAEAAEKVLPFENAMEQANLKWNAALSRIRDLERERDRLKEQADVLKEQADAAGKQNLPLIKELSQKAISIHNILHFYDDLSESLKELESKERVWKRAEESQQKAAGSCTSLKSRKEELQKELLCLETAGEMAVSVAKKEFDDLMQKRDSLDKIKASVEKVKGLIRELTSLNSRLTTARNEEAEAETTHRTLNSLFIQGQAGILAQDLREKLKTQKEAVCPVCGSVHTEADSHLFASLRDDIPTHDEVDKAYTAWQEARDATSRAAKEVNEKELEISVEKRSILVKISELIAVSDWNVLTEGTALSNAAAECDKLIPASKEKWERAEKEKKDKEKALSEKAKIDDLIDEAERTLSDAGEKVTAATSEVERAKTSVGNWRLQLKGYPESKAAAKERMDSLNDEARKLQEQIDDANDKYAGCQRQQAENAGNLKSAVSERDGREKEKETAEKKFDAQLSRWSFSDTAAYHKALSPEGKLLDQDELVKWIKDEKDEIREYDEKRNDLKAAIKQLTESTKDMQRTDIASIQAQIDDVDKKMKQLNSERTELEVAYQKDRDVYNNLSSIEKQRRKYRKVFDKLNPLTETADGKYSFSRYVLNDFFHRIIEQANIHLETMTDGEYCLVPKETGDGRMNIGLDLKVLNTITGLERETGSLSGGQLFEASLSLALGLSDIVQMDSTSSIRIDSMFIDEGFGSLDSGRLDKSIEVLEHLAAGKRQIGIISHVSRLDECLPKKIHVIAGERGSTVRIETDA